MRDFYFKYYLRDMQENHCRKHYSIFGYSQKTIIYNNLSP